ncbi:MAG: hypothetical protein H0V56_14385 [Chthoniobacterales bacterium]|nr:hypothetical protein [Chthoniobacterales bacterium]
MPPRPRVLPPPPRVIPPGSSPGSVSSAPSNYPGGAGQSGPKKETARISILPEPATPAPAVKMTKTQPLITAPAPKVHSAPVTVAPRAAGSLPATISPITPTPAPASTGSILDELEHIPLPVCWAILGVSAVILIIQIWNYVVL